MLTPTDFDFKETKAVLNGELEINESKKKLIDWIEYQFGVKVLHVVEDYLDSMKKKRLNVVLEEYKNVDSFRDKNYNYDSKKQNLISQKYDDIINSSTNTILSRFFSKKNDKYFVCFSAFNPIAKSDIINQVPTEMHAEFEKRNTVDPVWQIHGTSTGIIVFVYKESDIVDFQKSGKVEILKREFYEQVRAYDKHGYFRLDNISVGLDSKQNFDENYKSNWQYYYR